jgi:glycosyltransferase involved in cell wall biosynthesis
MRIKVLHIQETVTAGGVERRRLLIAKYLDKERFEQRLVCTFAQGPIVDKIEQYGVQVIPIGCFKGIFDFRQLQKVCKIIDEYKPDIIHGAVFEGVTMACICGFLKRVPVVIAEETSDPQNRSARGDFLLRNLCRAADCVVAISEGTKQYLLTRAKIPARKVRLINNGVDTPRIADAEELAALRSRYGIEKNDIVVGTAGRLQDAHKKFSDLIKAVAMIADRYPKLKLLIVGAGPDRDLLESTACEGKISERVIFAGYQADTAPFYQIMDIFCVPSHREGFGLVAAEAGFNRLPTVATRVGGLQYVIQDGQTGFLVPPDTPQAIAEKLEILINDPDLRKRFGEAGYERAKAEFSAEGYVGKIERMYEENLPH